MVKAEKCEGCDQPIPSCIHLETVYTVADKDIRAPSFSRMEFHCLWMMKVHGIMEPCAITRQGAFSPLKKQERKMTIKGKRIAKRNMICGISSEFPGF
jgi:hypothetical protein